jgi:trehalose 6-phosphate phosphatase
MPVVDLTARVRELAQTPVLLIASDYDGTLAPIVADPTQAVPMRESLVAIRALSELPDTHVAIISGRSLNELAAVDFSPNVHLVGSHGSEFDLGFAPGMDAETAARRGEIQRLVRKYAADVPGSLAEMKPTGAACR